MSEEKKGFTFDKSILLLTVTLLAFCVVVAGLLGLVNHVTAGPIEAHRAEKTARAMREVLAAEEYIPLDYSGSDSTVQSVHRAGDRGFVITVTPSGFGGTINMVVGVDSQGLVTGVSIVSMTETSGLGANASRESFRSQFVGRSGSVALRKQGGEIDALTGATVTSAAVTAGVNSALAAAAACQ